MAPFAADAAPPFGRVAIAGVGLIGGSIALGLRTHWPSVRVIGVDRAAVLAHARGSGAIDQGVERVSEIGDVDLVVLAAPVRQNLSLLGELAASHPGPLLVTDVGGTKREIAAAARELPAHLTFVGGHPLGGAERGGFGFARPDLFQDRAWIFTSDGPSSDAMLERLFQLASGLGARPTTMGAEQHDRLMAFVSHLPQLTASALMAVSGCAVEGDGLRLAGRGLIDTTRLASSPVDVWRDICASNGDAIGDALDALIARLTELRANLDEGRALETVFADAARWRAELLRVQPRS